MCWLTSLGVCAQEVSGLRAVKSGQHVVVSYDLSLANARIGSNKALVFIPVLTDYDGHIAMLPAVIVSGRSQHYAFLRRGGHPDYPDATEYEARKTRGVEYAEAVAYEDWMEHSTLSLRMDDCGCGGDVLSQIEVQNSPVSDVAYRPEFRFRFVTPAVELRKEREISGRANVEFVVDKWDIVEDYRGNYAEYQKIRQSVEQVQGDTDAHIVGIWLKGFASPESPYEHNTMLARNRVAAIKHYVQQLYGLPADIISTDYEPEDWAGLRQQVEASSIEHKAEVLALIDTDMDPDQREAQIRQRYPEEYRLMLSTWYPALRHTDYKIQYVISNFDDPRHCLELVKTAPQKLSLNEFYVAAQQLQPGSDDYNYVFETAVRMYPDSDVANLNAANIALSRGDTRAAERHLAKATHDAAAVNARAVLYALQGRYDEALGLFRQLASEGMAEAEYNIGEVGNVMRYAPAGDDAATDLPTDQ